MCVPYLIRTWLDEGGGESRAAEGVVGGSEEGRGEENWHF